MATYRSSSRRSYNLGATPPELVWTIVRGDTSAFRVYVEDDSGTPLTISEWTIDLEIKRPTNSTNLGIITDDANLVVELYPVETSSDGDGEFTVFLNSANSTLLETGDIFDIELTDGFRVWTVGQGSIVVFEDVTNSGGNS
jgi:hypothetical protein